MQRSPHALVLVAALGAGAALAPAPALAQAGGAPASAAPIRTGSSSIGGPFGVRLAVYDGRSFELFWNRIPNAVAYRVQVGDRTVQQSGAVSRYVSNVGLSGGFDYTLSALDRSGSAIRVQRFRVQPASAAQLVAVGDGASAPGASPDPTQPSGANAPRNLSVQVYSSTAAELFWRPGAFVDANEVRRDGVLIAELGGGGVNSYFDGAREPGRSYTYEVTAIDGAGRGSASVSDGGLGGTPTDPVAPLPPLGPATDPIRTGSTSIGGAIPVRLDVYDARSYELFWERVPGAFGYRLSRDGRLVREGSGTSYYVTGVDGSASFAYTLVAVDGLGGALRRTDFTVSPSAAVQLVAAGDGPGAPTTPTDPAPTDPSPTDPVAPVAGDESLFLPATLAAPLLAPIELGSALSVTNHETFVRAFYDIAVPRVLDNLLERLEGLQGELEDAVAGADSRFVAESVAPADGGTTQIVFACPDGGTVEAVLDDPAVDAADSRSRLRFGQCRIGDDTLSGTTGEAPIETGIFAGYDSRAFGGYDRAVLLYPFTDSVAGLGDGGDRFTVRSEAGLTTTVFGRVAERSSDFPGRPATDERRWRGNWQLRGPSGGTLLVTDLYADNVRREQDGRDGDTSKPYFVARGTVTNGREVTAINQRDFRESGMPGRGVSGFEVFSDAEGGIMDLAANSGFDGGGTRTSVRIDTDGVILNRTLPDELDATPYLTGP